MSEQSKALRFLIAGAANTIVTYMIYLGLLSLIGYVAAYTVCYVVGIAMSYALNTAFVFRSRPTLRSALLFPLIYVAQYLLGLAVLYLAVQCLGISRQIALAVSIVITLPVTYLLTRMVLRTREDESTKRSSDVRK